MLLNFLDIPAEFEWKSENNNNKIENRFGVLTKFLDIDAPKLKIMDRLNEDHEFTEKIERLERSYNMMKYAILTTGIGIMILLYLFQ